MLFRDTHQLPVPPGAGAADSSGDAAPSAQSRYLTDGKNLYRFLGAFPGGTAEMIGLEDCRSLEVILLESGALENLALRQVAPLTAA